MQSTDAKVLTVSQLNDYIKMIVDGNPVLSRLWVKGEISNLTFHSSGHIYFSIKDDKARISAIMFKSDASRLKFRLENGMGVVVRGRVSVFVRDGAYQIYAQSIEPDGIGALYYAYNQIKKKLEAEGLFDPSIKKPLPKIPMAVGIITSPTGAAVRDMINVCTRRFPPARLILFPALVQGDGAENDLVNGIRYFSANHSVDVVIIGRGGGSIEDLWAFNSEKLAYEIRRSSVPVISAVGHETDFTICDFASDRRAPTPSAAAELAVPDSRELGTKIANVTRRMTALLGSRLQSSRKQLEILSKSRVLTSPMSYLDDRRAETLMLSEDLIRSMNDIIRTNRSKYEKTTAVLDALSPLKIVKKGYSMVYGDDGKIIKSVNDVTVGEEVKVALADGEMKAAVTEIDHSSKGE